MNGKIPHHSGEKATGFHGTSAPVLKYLVKAFFQEC
jgi:hypothetical protein